MKMMNNTYPLEWLDTLILEHLNPCKTDLSRLSESELTVIAEHVVKESQRIQIRMKNEIFAIKSSKQIRLQVRKYHSLVIYLLDTMSESLKSSVFKRTDLAKCGQGIMKVLDDLLLFLENRYSVYLSLDEKVPITYLLVSRREMQQKLKGLQKRQWDDDQIRQDIQAVTEQLSSRLSLDHRSRITFRQVLYERKILKELEKLDGLDNHSFFSSLDHLLIGLNFNCTVYINLVLQRMISKLEMQKGVSEKLELLSYYFKEFGQIPSNEKLFFNAGMPHVKIVLGNWFQHEIQYLEKQLGSVAVSSGEQVILAKQETKLECDLSADQIGIILRAADEARVVKSRSMSLVFQRIVPHLSTAFKKDLSYQSVRSKSYNAEENDKNTAIQALEKMIKKIRSY